MKPNYQVGETVILQSPSKPHLNGQYIIDEVLDMREDTTYTCQFTGRILDCGLSGFSYRFDVPHMDGFGRELLNRESSLRKKHKGSDDSFEEMMSKLKIKEEA